MRQCAPAQGLATKALRDDLCHSTNADDHARLTRYQGANLYMLLCALLSCAEWCRCADMACPAWQTMQAHFACSVRLAPRAAQHWEHSTASPSAPVFINLLRQHLQGNSSPQPSNCAPASADCYDMHMVRKDWGRAADPLVACHVAEMRTMTNMSQNSRSNRMQMPNSTVSLHPRPCGPGGPCGAISLTYGI